MLAKLRLNMPRRERTILPPNPDCRRNEIIPLFAASHSAAPRFGQRGGIDARYRSLGAHESKHLRFQRDSG